ncbi:hypothetical protein A6R68_15611, partial [Neotoma lepida]
GQLKMPCSPLCPSQTLRQAWFGRSFRLRRLGGNSAVSGLAGFLDGADWLQEEGHFNSHPDTTAQGLVPCFCLQQSHKHHEEAAVLSAGAAVHPGVKGQQVKQSPVSLVLQEGESAELQCNFSTSATQMQWFYQSPGGHLISLFYNPSGTKQNGRLKSTTVTQERRSSLYISSSQTTDSGTYFCAMNAQCSPHTCSLYTNLQLGGHGPSQILYSPKSNSSTSSYKQAGGEQVTMDCSYETSKSFYQLYWYKQPPSGDMIFLIHQISSSHHNESSGRYSVVFQKSAKSISLIISASQVEDLMNYFCALGTRLTVFAVTVQAEQIWELLKHSPPGGALLRSTPAQPDKQVPTTAASCVSSSLSITDAKTADTAVYFCATDAQFAAGTCSPDTNPQSCFLDPS